MFKGLVYRLGSNPEKSWKTFKLGLVIFVLGAMTIIVGPKLTHLLQIPGLVALAAGFALAAKGYAGIFCNRFAQTLNRGDALRARFEHNKSQD